MASKYWVKLYVEILDDPKIMVLPPTLRWRFIECILQAKDHGTDGELPPADQMAWRVRDEAENVTADLDALVTHGLLIVTGGVYAVKRFTDRQKADSVAKRMQEYRKRKKDGNGGVTQMLRDFTEEEEELEKEKEEEADEDEESSSDPNIFDMGIAVLRISGTNPTTAQVEKLWATGVTEERAMAWYKDQEHGWPSIRPPNAERPDPWLSQVMEHLPNYRTEMERRHEDAEKYGYESGAE